jgi:hypothetical protein
LAERMPNEAAITALQIVQASVRDENANICWSYALSLHPLFDDSNQHLNKLIVRLFFSCKNNF